MAAPSEEKLICDQFNLEALTVNQVKSFYGKLMRDATYEKHLLEFYMYYQFYLYDHFSVTVCTHSIYFRIISRFTRGFS